MSEIRVPDGGSLNQAMEEAARTGADTIVVEGPTCVVTCPVGEAMSEIGNLLKEIREQAKRVPQ